MFTNGQEGYIKHCCRKDHLKGGGVWLQLGPLEETRG